MITKEAINSIRNHVCEISKIQAVLELEINTIGNDLLDWAESNLSYLDCLNDQVWNTIPKTGLVLSVDKDGIVSLYNHTYGSYNSEFEFSYSFNSDWLIYPELLEKHKLEVEKNKIKEKELEAQRKLDLAKKELERTQKLVEKATANLVEIQSQL